MFANMDFQSIWMLSKICFNIWVMKAIWSFGQWCQWWLLRQHPDPAKTMIGAPTDGRTFKTCSKDTHHYLIQPFFYFWSFLTMIDNINYWSSQKIGKKRLWLKSLALKPGQSLWQHPGKVEMIGASIKPHLHFLPVARDYLRSCNTALFLSERVN